MILGGLVAAAALWIQSGNRAEACSYPPPIQIDDDLSQPITGVPTSGVVPLYVQARLEEVEGGYPRMTVVDAGDTAVGGALELSPTRLLWRADSPLAPESTYRATLELSSWDTVELTFTTGATDAAPRLALEPMQVDLREISRADEEICCDSGINSCGFEEYEHCWTQTATYLPSLEVVLEVDRVAARYYRFEFEAPGADASYSGVGSRYGSWASATFPSQRAEYCVTFRALSLTGGGDVERTVCRAHETIESLPPFRSETPDYSMCDDAPVDPETDEEIDTGGCSTGGGCAPALALCLVALVVAAPRRRV